MTKLNSDAKLLDSTNPDSDCGYSVTVSLHPYSTSNYELKSRY